MADALRVNDLTHVGVGSPMGGFMREYWIPAALSSELVADKSPMRLMLLGERLIAFRDTSGKIGVMDHRCPHRGASLFLGRNEEGGIRCIYHGWKFDTDGRCTDQMNLQPEQVCKDRIRAAAYKVVEQSGIVWVYMGRKEVPPPMPLIEAALLPASELTINFVQRECNWLQSLEGDIDTSHFGILHLGSVRADEVAEDNLMRHTVEDRAPKYQAADTPWGTMYAAHRLAQGGSSTYWRIAHFMFPFWTLIPNGDFDDFICARAWVPMDDTHTMFVHMMWKKSKPGIGELKDGTLPKGVSPFNYRPNTPEWYGRWRLEENADNDYLIDRDAQSQGEIFSGIQNIHLQDQAVTESMGPIVDHSREHLAASDLMIARTRRRLLNVVAEFGTSGAAAPGTEDPEIFLGARSGYFMSGENQDWRRAYGEVLATATRLTL
jgi:phthalate 4,5-dioxygenase oxygenase subunit